jgi:hypothetical protein
MKIELQLKEGAVAQAVQLTDAACAETLEWKQKVEGNIPSTVFQVLVVVLALIPLSLFVWSRLGERSGQHHHGLWCAADGLRDQGAHRPTKCCEDGLRRT